MNSCSYSSPNVVNAWSTDREVNCARSRDICPRNKTSQFIFVCERSRLSTIQQWLGCFCFFSRDVEFTFSYLKDVYSLLFYTFSLVDYLIAFHWANYATTRNNSYAEVGIFTKFIFHVGTF